MEEDKCVSKKDQNHILSVLNNTTEMSALSPRISKIISVGICEEEHQEVSYIINNFLCFEKISLLFSKLGKKYNFVE